MEFTIPDRAFANPVLTVAATPTTATQRSDYRKEKVKAKVD